MSLINHSSSTATAHAKTDATNEAEKVDHPHIPDHGVEAIVVVVICTEVVARLLVPIVVIAVGRLVLIVVAPAALLTTGAV